MEPIKNGLTELKPSTVASYFPHPDRCQYCGFPPGVPGYLRRLDNQGVAPCPACNAVKLTERARLKTQLTGNLKTMTLDNYNVTDDNKAAHQAAIHFIRHPSSWLTFYGPYGDGKTHLCAGIANALPEARYFTLPDLLSQYRAAVGRGEVEQFYDRISVIRVLIVDEIDKASLGNWTREQVYRLFDHRYRMLDEMGTVLAMNDNPHRVNDELGYLFSRMKDERCRVVYVGSVDNRPKADTLGKLAGL